MKIINKIHFIIEAYTLLKVLWKLKMLAIKKSHVFFDKNMTLLFK